MGCGSGPGSTKEYTIQYREFLSKFIKDNKIKTILDIGCGDFQMNEHFDWIDYDYTGIDS